jgi:hypothetical protein
VTPLELLAPQESCTWCCATPVPVNASTTEVVEALLLKEIVPEAVPLLCGVNVTFTCALCPAASAIGNETPFKLNSGLLVLADETVTLELLALSVAVKLLFWPTVMVPKSSVVGNSSNCPEAVAYPKAQSSNWNLKRQTQ